MSADEEAFLQQIAEPDSDDVRLVFADWLEERGDIRAEYLRLEVGLYRLGQVDRSPEQEAKRRRFLELARRIDPAWRGRVDRVLGIARPVPPPPPSEPRRERAQHVPSWATLGDRGQSGATGADGPRAHDTGFEWGINPTSLLLVLLLLAAALGTSGCLFVTHLECHGGRQGVCSLDSYGLFTTVRHVDVPVHEIVAVSVDEHKPRRGPSAAKVAILTRSMGSIDLAGGQLISSAFATSDAVEAAVALRQLLSTDASTPKNVDLWIGSSLPGTVIVVPFSLLCWFLLVKAVASVVGGAK